VLISTTSTIHALILSKLHRLFASDKNVIKIQVQFNVLRFRFFLCVQ